MSNTEHRRQLVQSELLKRDTFGAVLLCKERDGGRYVARDLSVAKPWARPLARWLMHREAIALGSLPGSFQAPRLLALRRNGLHRTFVAGAPMYEAKPRDIEYFRAARKLLHRLHRAGLTHNDLAKEPNWLVTDDGLPALVDFQLASVFRKRTWRFRQQAREDVRHLLKHKRTYLPDHLTQRERAILDRPSLPSRIWRATGKKLYLFVTRVLLNWSDREGAADRGKK
ncbi:MAG: serine/threonine protein kinase [Pseudomonadota bacterium]